MDNKDNWAKLIEVINRPLGFFALALLIVETSLAIILVFSSLIEEHKFIGMLLVVALFVFVVIIVTILVWCRPKYLIYSEEAHLKDKFIYGSDKTPMKVEDIHAGEKQAEGKNS
jgi:hypothetical protein